jgi:hypothetical protein
MIAPDDWRRIPQSERPYDAYRRGRYIEPGCDHAGPYCKCDPAYHLRSSSPSEKAHEARKAAQADAKAAG